MVTAEGRKIRRRVEARCLRTTAIHTGRALGHTEEVTLQEMQGVRAFFHDCSDLPDFTAIFNWLVKMYLNECIAVLYIGGNFGTNRSHAAGWLRSKKQDLYHFRCRPDSPEAVKHKQ
jgi:hypothetical protein